MRPVTTARCPVQRSLCHLTICIGICSIAGNSGNGMNERAVPYTLAIQQNLVKILYNYQKLYF